MKKPKEPGPAINEHEDASSGEEGLLLESLWQQILQDVPAERRRGVVAGGVKGQRKSDLPRAYIYIKKEGHA